MTLWCCITPERDIKTRRIMEAFAAGCGGRIVLGDPPADRSPFVVWGQEWLTLRIVPHAIATGRPWYHVDNGYYLPAGGTATGYYRITYRSMSPFFLEDPPMLRSKTLRPRMASWRTTGRHVLLALPGASFGRAAGVDVPGWLKGIGDRLGAATRRPIVVRPKGDTTRLDDHLRNCWALVTHSSNVAIDAVIAGVPVFVESTSPAAPVGRVDWGPGDIESPEKPDRSQWWFSLMAQQFTLEEMARGVARPFMRQAVLLDAMRTAADGQAKQA